MKSLRYKIDSRSFTAVYHCVTRTVAGLRLDEAAKEILRKQLWLTADFCGVHILTHAIMSNHIHVLVRVPLKTEVPDAELLRRFQVLHPKPTEFQTARIENIAEMLKTGGPGADAWRNRQLALMNDVSQFMKLLKQRFSIWFNRNHNRHGTLWSERFKSVLVEGRGNPLSTMAAYIDLNPVRAGMVADPKDYRFCGYAEAVGGNKNARAGITAIVTGENNETWRVAHDAYRTRLFVAGAVKRAGKATITPAALEKVMEQKGTVPLAEVLRCRVWSFTNGVVLGSKIFVAEQLAAYQRLAGRRKRTASPLRSLPPVTDWGDMVVMRGSRKNVFG